MPEQSTCICGRAYSSQEFLLDEHGKCPACGQALCLARCGCGAALVVNNRQEDGGIAWKSHVDFRCFECGKTMSVPLESRKHRALISLVSAVLLGVVAFACTLLMQHSSEGFANFAFPLAIIAGIGAFALVYASFHLKIGFW